MATTLVNGDAKKKDGDEELTMRRKDSETDDDEDGDLFFECNNGLLCIHISSFNGVMA